MVTGIVLLGVSSLAQNPLPRCSPGETGTICSFSNDDGKETKHSFESQRFAGPRLGTGELDRGTQRTNFSLQANRHNSSNWIPGATTNAQLRAQPETASILEKSRTAVYSRSTCLLHYLKSYTEHLKRGSFQSNRRANRRVGAWCVCVFGNRRRVNPNNLRPLCWVYLTQVDAVDPLISARIGLIYKLLPTCGSGGFCAWVYGCERLAGYPGYVHEHSVLAFRTVVFAQRTVKI
ncbi:hypothetical protein CRENBAI_011092 [Crenichthys baileyi]|uniref:Secreted protein n=1 Tax=Crenichthys baileyi TaxID=28760 RepID=A0AAV9S770_9TELE